MSYQGSSYGMMGRGGAVSGGRGRSFFGSGATGARGGPKRKPFLPGSEAGVAQGGDVKKPNATVDTWSSPPIAQQPLGQTSVDGYGDVGVEWYRDTSYPSGMGQTWQ